MEKKLENIYKEEYVRTKARYDFEKNLAIQQNSKKNSRKQYYQALFYILLGSAGIYILYAIYQDFV
ncbi:MAG: hypothetical protein PWQ67_383 [Clostridia bacterium]|jgi:hypothetical protein|nr:hypothetical protein [Clostridia bacterium]MDN5321929.1 hypothetical protein [Clostridia bacterium]